MTTPAITVEATLQPDGVTLELEKKLALPPGRVTVTVHPIIPGGPGAGSKGEPGPGPTMLEVLDRIHEEQRRLGHRPMSEEEMTAELARRRQEDDEYEERWREIWSQTRGEAERTDNP